MTPRQADKLIKAGLPVTVETVRRNGGVLSYGNARLRGSGVGVAADYRAAAYVGAVCRVPGSGIAAMNDYRRKSEAELRYIVKDAGEAARVMQGNGPGFEASESKYLDQVNDACSELGRRLRASVRRRYGNGANMEREEGA